MHDSHNSGGTGDHQPAIRTAALARRLDGFGGQVIPRTRKSCGRAAASNDDGQRRVWCFASAIKFLPVNIFMCRSSGSRRPPLRLGDPVFVLHHGSARRASRPPSNDPRADPRRADEVDTKPKKQPTDDGMKQRPVSLPARGAAMALLSVIFHGCEAAGAGIRVDGGVEAYAGNALRRQSVAAERLGESERRWPVPLGGNRAGTGRPPYDSPSRRLPSGPALTVGRRGSRPRHRSPRIRSADSGRRCL